MARGRTTVIARSFRLLALAAAALVLAGATEFEIGPPPDWVTPLAIDETAAVPVEQVTGGVYFLLADGQTRLDEQSLTVYRHIASQAVNERGLEAIAQIAVRFDPSYERLALHWIRIRRGGVVIDKLRQEDVRVLQREENLERRIYDGSKTANVFLEDVRVGDIVEYAFTVHGGNPVFAGRHWGRIDLQWSVPIRHVRGRLLWPSGREIAFVPRNTDVRPTVAMRDGWHDHAWTAENVAALSIEADAPVWYDPYAHVQWSEFPDWAAVARWAVPLYRTPERPGPVLQEAVDAIARASDSPRERLLAVLDFVQREVRYLGVVVGAQSHGPTPPDVVLERRFGDCKDSSLLMVTMLRALGIEAHAALVHTTRWPTLRDAQPSPDAFDHALVRVRLDGSAYWLDPTRLPQKGALQHLTQAAYGHALVVDERTQVLSPMGTGKGNVVRRQVHLRIDSRAGADQPAGMKVTTVTEGETADSLRFLLASTTRDELQKQYLNYYDRYYPGVAVAAPLEVADAERENRITVTEHYVIPAIWRRPDGGGQLEAAIHSPELEPYLQNPRQTVRTAPLAVPHPIRFEHRTEVLLPETFAVEPSRTVVSSGAFEFERVVRLVGNGGDHVELIDRYESRADHVSAADVPTHAADLDRARAELGYSFWFHESPGAAVAPAAVAFNWPVAVIGLLAFVLWLGLALRVYRQDPPPAAGPVDETLRGLRSWLAVAAIGAVVSPLVAIGTTVDLLSGYDGETWAALTTPQGAAFHPLWAPALLFELAVSLGLCVFTVLAAVLFFRKRTSAPRVMVVLLVAEVVFQGTDLAFAGSIPGIEVTSQDLRHLVIKALSAAAWSAYFLRSERVKATFVNRLRARAAALAEPPALEPTAAA